jgi:hypothetical protein
MASKLRFIKNLLLAGCVATGTILALIASDAFAKNPSRQKVIDFDDAIVEGLNKQPLDSYSQISEREKKRRKPHLYRKRASFNNETTETLGELRYIK